jgi:hypothetical protein
MATTFVPTELTYRQTSHNLVDNNPIQRRGNLRTGTRPVPHRDILDSRSDDRSHTADTDSQAIDNGHATPNNSQRNVPWDKPWSSHLRMGHLF